MLFQHECVIIPEFGGFVTNYFPAEINSSINSIIPPSKAISFNSNLVQNDGLLANFISRNEDISFDDAKKSLSDYTKKLNEKLRSGERIKMNGIGSFKIDENEKLQFEPALSHNFLVDSFGLSPINIEEIRTGALEEAYKNIEKKKRFSKKGKSRRNKSFLESFFSNRRARNILIGIPIILIMIILPFNVKLSKLFKLDSAGMNPINELTESINKGSDEENSTKSVALDEISSTILGNHVSTIDDDMKMNENNYPEDRFFLIAGSFKYSNNAEVYSKNLSNQGYTSKIIPFGNQLYRVSVSSFLEKRTAFEKLNQIYSETNKIQLWILEK